MIGSVITFLIFVCLLAIVIYLIFFIVAPPFRDIIGLPIPEKVIQLLWVIVALIAILMLVNMVMGGSSFHLPRLT